MAGCCFRSSCQVFLSGEEEAGESEDSLLKETHIPPFWAGKALKRPLTKDCSLEGRGRKWGAAAKWETHILVPSPFCPWVHILTRISPLCRALEWLLVPARERMAGDVGDGCVSGSFSAWAHHLFPSPLWVAAVAAGGGGLWAGVPPGSCYHRLLGSVVASYGRLNKYRRGCAGELCVPRPSASRKGVNVKGS